MDETAEAKVHEKYLVVIPKEVREKMALKVGDRIEFVIEGKKVMICPKRGDTRAIGRTHGIISWKKSVDVAIGAGYAKMGKER